MKLQDLKGELRSVMAIGYAILSLGALADSEMVNGITWQYYVEDGEAVIGRRSKEMTSTSPSAIPETTKGSISVPSTLGGYPVTKIGFLAFYNCNKIVAVTIPDGVVEITGSFYLCAELTSVSLPETLKRLENFAFSECSNLASLKLPAGLAHISETFAMNCPNLTSVSFSAPNENYVIVEGAIYSSDKTKLVWLSESTTHLHIPAELVDVPFEVFRILDNLVSIEVDEGNSVYSSRDGILCDKSGSSLLSFPGGWSQLVIPEGVTSLKTVLYGAKLTYASIPASLTELPSDSYYMVFSSSWLDRIDVAAENPAYISTGTMLFDKGKTELIWCAPTSKAITVPESVASIRGYAFSTGETGQTIIFQGPPPELKTAASYSSAGGYFQAYGKGSCKGYYTAYESEWENVIREGKWNGLPMSYKEGGANQTYTVIVGAKASVDVGLKGQGYSTKALPKGLAYSDKTGLVTGTCKTATAAEGVEVTFTKKNAEDVVVNFVVRKENEPTVACAGLTNGTLAVGVSCGGRGATALPIAIDAESGVKSVTATKLPTGMKIASNKAKTEWYITGAPTKAGAYEVAITLTTAAGNKKVETFKVEVEALPMGATGTFNGFVLVDAFVSNASDKDGSTSSDAIETIASTGNTLNYGTLQVTVSDVGKITAKVVAAAGTYSFTATGWDNVNEGVYSVKMATKKGDVLTLACDSTAAWNTKQLTGTFTPVDAASRRVSEGGDSSSDGRGEDAASTYAVEAQKNAFGKQWFFAATGDETSGWTLSFSENAKSAALTVTLNADGKTAVAGTLYGAPAADGTKTSTPSYKVSSSGYADVSGIAVGAIFADFAPVISVKSGKTTTKKVLSLRANLWFDKKNDHEQGVGSAVFVQ